MESDLALAQSVLREAKSGRRRGLGGDFCKQKNIQNYYLENSKISEQQIKPFLNC